MARIRVPDGPGGEAAMVWQLRPEMGTMVATMVRTVYGSSILPTAEREAVRMKIAEINNCDACSSFRAPSVQAAGVDEALYCHIGDYQTSWHYTERQRLAMEYAERFAIGSESVDDEFFQRLRAAFADPEILDLTMCIAAYLGLGRALAVLRIDEPAPMDV